MAVEANHDRWYQEKMVNAAVGVEQNIRALKDRIDRLEAGYTKLLSERQMLVEKRATVEPHLVIAYDKSIAHIDEAIALNRKLLAEAGTAWWDRSADRERLKKLMATAESWRPAVRVKRTCIQRPVIRQVSRNSRGRRIQRTTARRLARKAATGDPPSEPDSSASLRSSAGVAS